MPGERCNEQIFGHSSGSIAIRIKPAAIPILKRTKRPIHCARRHRHVITCWFSHLLLGSRSTNSLAMYGFLEVNRCIPEFARKQMRSRTYLQFSNLSQHRPDRLVRSVQAFDMLWRHEHSRHRAPLLRSSGNALRDHPQQAHPDNQKADQDDAPPEDAIDDFIRRVGHH